jgi:hypothetical protein
MIITDEFMDTPMVMEATIGGVRLIPYHKWKTHNTIVSLLDPGRDISDEIKESLWYLGSGYDYTGVVGNIRTAVGKWFKKKWRNTFRNRNRQFCSELCTRIAIASELLPASYDPESTAPVDLLEGLSKTCKEVSTLSI